MLKKLLTVALLLISISAFAGTYSGGDGSQTYPYKIGTIADINELGSTPWDWNSHFVMINDVNINGATVDMIGTDMENAFSGVFDGNEHTISNFNCSSSEFQTGLFGFVKGVDAEIRDLIIENVSINCSSNYYSVGTLVGYLDEAKILGCDVQGAYIQGGIEVGGLIGCSRYGKISDCHAIVDIENSETVGGLVGRIFEWTTIENSSAHGNISATGGDVGGLVASTFMECLIENCYADVSLSGQDSVGGLVGCNGTGYSSSKIFNSYSSGSVAGTESVGGLVGRNDAIVVYCYSTCNITGPAPIGGLFGSNDGIVISSYWDIDTSGVAVGYGSVGEGKSTGEMKSKSTYIGWGCNSAWTIDNGNEYPKLAWQNLPGQPIDNSLSDYLSGNGSSGEPYLIRSAEDFNSIGFFVCEWDKHFKLISDINYPSEIILKTNYNMIGFYELEFSGVFDGNDHKIINLFHSSSNKRAVGLFGYVKGASAEIKSLRLINPVLDSAGSDLGAFVGILKDGKITNCHVEGGAVVNYESSAGGLVGRNEEGKIRGCSSTAVTHGSNRTGGIAGYNSGLIEKSYTIANASINDSYSYVGGLVGENDGTINYCYSSGKVDGDGWNTLTGGLVGAGGIISNSYSIARVEGDPSMNSYSGGIAGRRATIINCYSTGVVLNRGNAGGLMGDSGSATDSFWDIETSGLSTSAGGVGAMGKTTTEMQMIETFTSHGWDFFNIWRLCENNINYPTLSWQTSFSGDFVCSDGVNFIDYSYFANHWLNSNCWSSNNCNNTDLDFSGSTDWNDLMIFCDNWLMEE